jgi:glycosyltransferase involved in cell wall biosynthesis
MAGRRLATAAACRAEAAALGVRFDVIESPDYLAQGLALLPGGTPVAAYAHTPRWVEPSVWLADRFERELLRRAVIVRCPSRILGEHLLARRWVNPSRLHVMDPPIELDDWTVSDVPDGPPVVLLAGRFDAVKAPEIAVLAAAALRRVVPDLTLRFVGKALGRRDGVRYGDWLWGLARTLGVRHEVVDDLPRAELGEHYARATVVAIPSTGDNLPMVGLEAMACGRAVITSDTSGLADVIAGTGAGEIVPAGDPVALAQALLPYVTAAGHAAEAGRRARAVVEARFDPDRVAANVEALYAEVAGRC